MKNSVIALGVFSLAMALSFVAVYLLLERMIEQHAFVAYVVKPAPEDIPPADISALHEEIRRIQREAGDA